MTAVVGAASAEGFPGTATPDPGAQASICNFAPQDGGTSFNVTVKVERYSSSSSAHDAFAPLAARLQPTQVSGFDDAAASAGSARLLHGSDVVWIDMFVSTGLPPTAVSTLAAAVGKHYGAPSATTQKPAVAGPGDVDPCATSLKGLKAAFHVAVKAEPVVSDPGTHSCEYTFAGHGSVVETTTTPGALAKLQPPMTLQQFYDKERSSLIPSQTVDLSGIPGRAAISFDTTVIQCTCGDEEARIQQIREYRKAQSEEMRLWRLEGPAAAAVVRIMRDAAKAAHTKVDPKTVDAVTDGLQFLESATSSSEDREDLGVLLTMLTISK